MKRNRLLIVCPYSVFPMIHGGAVRIGNLMKVLADQYEIFALIMIGGTDDPEQRRALAEIGVTPFFQQTPLAAGHPKAEGFFSPLILERIRALVTAHQIDLVQLEYTEMGGYVPGLKALVPVVLVEHDIAFRSLERQLAVGDNPDSSPRLNPDQLRRMELVACSAADLIHVMSEEDRQFLTSHLETGADRIRVIANGVDTTFYRPPQSEFQREGALFVGSFPHRPNQDALRWLHQEIWPRLRQRAPHAQLTVAGARPPAWVLELDGLDGITVAGEVDDLRSLYHTHRVLIAPIRSGSGTRLKILEAMASELPVISTTLGAEGLELKAGRDLWIADDVDGLVGGLHTLLKPEDTLGRQMAASARTLAHKKFDWNAIIERAVTGYEELLAQRSAPTILIFSVSSKKAQPAISVIVHGTASSDDCQSCIHGLQSQNLEADIEVLWTPHVRPPDTDGVNMRWLRIESDHPPGRLLNAGASAARAPILVFLAVNARPISESWLARITEPFDHPNAPAAVLGGITASLSEGGPSFDPFFTSLENRWKENHGGVFFSTVNGAIRRDIWNDLPFTEDHELPDKIWQRQAKAAQHLILPCLDAHVSLHLARSPRRDFCEGRDWRSLHYSISLQEIFREIARLTRPAGQPAISRRLIPFHLLRFLSMAIGNRVI